MRLISTLFILLAIQVISLRASEPNTVVSSDVVPHPRQPQVAVVDESTVYVTFGSNNKLFLCKSTDGGLSFDSPVQVGSVEKLALGMRRGPRVVANDKFVIVTAISHESGDLSAWKSADLGLTWSAPLVINDIPRVAREGLHGMAIAPDGKVFCVWLDLRNGRTQIYGASTSDEGRTWTENRRIYESPSGTVCECCHPSVAIDGKGVIHVMWRNVVDGNRDMYLATSMDGGESFQTARKLGLGSWHLNACPMDGGDLAAPTNSDVVTVWRRNNQIFAAGDKPLSERLLGIGEQPGIAVGANGEFIVWLSRRGGDLNLLKPGSSSPTTIATNASDPVIVATVNSPQRVIVAWESGSMPNTAIKVMAIAD